MIDWSLVHAESLPYGDFLARHGSDTHRTRWAGVLDRVRLTDDQSAVVGGFVRRMPVVCLAGAWCGDCIEQGPILEQIAQAAPGRIDLRFLDRDARPEVRDALSLCGGHRVPVVVWCDEDFHEVSRFGDRVLSKYRQLAADKLGASCPTGLVPPGEVLLSRMTAEWVDQFERVHLMLRLSTRLRDRYQD